MLPRLLEPEVMDSAQEAHDYDSMDHSAVNRRFVEDLLATLDAAGDSQSPTVLDLGTGTAQIPIELCRQQPGIRVVALDLAEEMLKLARRNVSAAGLDDRIECRLCDAKRLPLADGSFTAVMSNSIVHHIPQPAAALAEAVRVCRPGGRLFFRDLLRPNNQAELQWLVEQYAAGATERQRALFAASLYAALTVEEMQRLVAALGFPKNTVTQTSDRHWTWNAAP